MSRALLAVPLLFAALAAGCMEGGPSNDTRTTTGATPAPPMDLGAAEEWTLDPTPFSPLPCEPDAQPSHDATLLPPYSDGLADVVRATAGILDADLWNVTLGNRTLTAGDVQYRLTTRPDSDGIGAPPRIEITIEGRLWPGREGDDLDTPMAGLMEAVAPEEARVWWDQVSERGALGHTYQEGGGGPVGALQFGASSVYDPPRSWILIDPWYALPEAADDDAWAPLVEGYTACAHPGAEAQGRSQWRVQYGTATREFLVQTPDPDHHCGGPAWWIGVDATAGAVIGDRVDLCY